MKLFSTLAIFLASFISTILAGDCNNPLLAVFNITSLETPTTVTDIKYCKSLQSSESCCSAETINGFQEKADALAEKLKAIVAARDQQIVDTRDKVIPQLKNSLEQLKNNSQQALNVLKGKKQPNNGNATNGDQNPPPQGGNQTEGQLPPPPPNGTNNTDPQGQLPPPPDGNNTEGQLPPPPPNGTNNTDPQGQHPPPPPNGTNNTDPHGQPPPPPNGTNGTNPQGQQPGRPQPNPINESSPGFTAASSLAESIGKLSQEIVDGLPNIKGNFSNFQKSRSTCVIEMVKLQAAAWCLSCDPDYASKGVGVSDSNSVQLSNNVCGRLQGSCYDFISQSSQQSAILSIKQLAPKIGKMSEGLQMIIADNSTGLSQLTDAADGADSGNNNAPPVGVPPNCTADDCPWICTDLFKNGQVNDTLISAGGEISSVTDSSEEDGSSRILIEEGTVVKNKLMKKRNLQTSEWNPDQDEAGVQVAFAEDPAGVNTSSSDNSGRLLQASLMGLVALMTIFMI